MSRNICVVNNKGDFFRNREARGLVSTRFDDLTLYSFERANWLPTNETYNLALQAATALERFTNSQNRCQISVVDVGTGSGVIAITIANQLKSLIEAGRLKITATDISGDALAVAQLNAEHNNLERYIDFRMTDILHGLDSADVIVTNPPFSRSSEVDGGWFDKIPFATRLALDGGEDGMDVYRRLFDQASTMLHPKGFMLLQCRDKYIGHLIQEAQLRMSRHSFVLKDAKNRINALVLGNGQTRNLFY